MSQSSSELCGTEIGVAAGERRASEIVANEHSSAAKSFGPCPCCLAAKTYSPAPRLMTRTDADLYLALSTDQVERLIRTGQITVLKIRGEERFDRRDLDLAIETYKKTAIRRRG